LTKFRLSSEWEPSLRCAIYRSSSSPSKDVWIKREKIVLRKILRLNLRLGAWNAAFLGILGKRHEKRTQPVLSGEKEDEVT